MSTLKTNNIEHIDASTPSVQMSVGGGVVFPGISTFTGNTTFSASVSIGGTLTYEDVTSIDSVGIITAKSGIQVTGGSIGIGTAIPGALLSIESTAANAARIRLGFDSPRYYDIFRGSTTNSGYLNFYGSQSSYVGYTFGGVDGEWMRITTAGDMGLGTNNPTSDGGTTFEIYNATTPTLRLNDGGDYKALFQLRGNDLEVRGSNGNMEFYTGAADGASSTERLRITSAGLVRVTDSATLSFGNGDDMRIFHDGGSANYIDVYNKDLYIRCNRDAGITGGDIILQPKSGESSAIFRDDGAVELYYDNSKKLETVSSGVKVTNRLFLGGSTNGGFDYNAVADTLEFLTTNGGTHSELTSSAYVPSTNGGKNLGHHNKRWGELYVNGIKFNGDTAAANMLDDYEEGTYTPYLMGSTGNPTYTVSTNRSQYVKIGRLVDVTIDMSINIGGQGSGDFFVTLPFIVENNGSKSYSELTSARNNSWFNEGNNLLSGYTLQNTNQGYPRRQTGSAGAESAITWVTHTNGGGVRIALRWMYYTAT